MLEGSFRHEDFCGHKGVINPGDLQVGNITLKYLKEIFQGFYAFYCITFCL